jgi:hypothetical protein
MVKKIKNFLLFVILFIVFFCLFLFLQPRPDGFSSQIRWGVAFSKPFASGLGLDWQKTYLAVLDDLKIKYLRLPVYWEEVEPQSDNYVFNDYDWMIKEAEKRNVKLILIVGYKLPRWPECHKPKWATPENSLDYIKTTINRYKNSPALYLWQIENEPFLKYGDCPDYNPYFTDKEIELVRSLDMTHPILTTDSGEIGFWWRAAGRGDIFGTTMYRIIWDKWLGYIRYDLFLPKQFFWLKANLLRLFYPDKQIIVSELQAEPWGNGAVQDLSLEEQFKSFDLKKFQANVDFAKKTGFSEAYFWGAEWWYWMKEKQNNPSFWNYAKEIFK